ncbi:MAG TPA: hypothetical protein DHC76_02290, partial [Rhodobacteraceae bacterium]|nr:hypothetical protein [Paracoccaceae bacterium]
MTSSINKRFGSNEAMIKETKFQNNMQKLLQFLLSLNTAHSPYPSVAFGLWAVRAFFEMSAVQKGLVPPQALQHRDHTGWPQLYGHRLLGQLVYELSCGSR